VLVDGTHTEVAAAGHGAVGLAETAQHSANEVVAGPDAPGQGPYLLGQGAHLYVGAIQLHGGAIDHAHVGPHALQHTQKRVCVADLGQIFQAAYTAHHDRCGDNGYRRVFRAGDLYLAVQLAAAVDNISFHMNLLSIYPTK
jgi:hypothetical protein